MAFHEHYVALAQAVDFTVDFQREFKYVYYVESVFLCCLEVKTRNGDKTPCSKRF